MPQLPELAKLCRLGQITVEMESLVSLKRDVYFLALEQKTNEFIKELAERGLFDNVLGAARKGHFLQAVIDHEFANIALQEKAAVLEWSSRKQEYMRQHTLGLIEGGTSLGFEPHELAMVKVSCRLASVADRVFIKWWKDVVDSPIGQELAKMGEKKAGEVLRERKLADQYSILVGENLETARQIAYAEAYFEEYAEADRILAGLIGELEHTAQTNLQVALLVDYFKAYRIASANCDLSQSEPLWEAVDVAWLKVKGPVIPVHAMEYDYADPGRQRVMPEWRLCISDSRYDKVNQACQVTKAALLKHLPQRYPNSSGLKASMSALQGTESGIFIAGVLSGINLMFRYTGQSVPNRDKVAIRHGRKVFLDMEPHRKRMELRKRFFRTVFGKESEPYLDLIKDEEIMALEIAGHEVGHAAFLDADTEEKMGKEQKAKVEEGKATLTGMVILPQRITAGEFDEKMLLRATVGLIAGNIRAMTFEEQTLRQPYFWPAVVEMNAAFEAGLISRDEKGFHFNPDERKLKTFYEIMGMRLNDLVAIYDNPSPAAVEKYMTRFVIVGKNLRTLIDIAKTVPLS